MRSDLVFEAIYHVPNRYQLCQLASKVTRRMHRSNTRVPDTANHVLSNLRSFKLGSGCANQACNVGSINDASPPNRVLSIVKDSPGAILGGNG